MLHRSRSGFDVPRTRTSRAGRARFGLWPACLTRVGEWASAGAIAATGLWIIGSYGFSIYLSRFAGYDQTYGSVGAIVVLLIWFRLGAYAVLLGVQLTPDRTAAAPEQHPCGGISWPLGAAPPLRGIGASRTGAELQPAPTEGRFERDLVPTVLVPLVERLKRRTRDKDVLTLCEYVHGTIPGFRRTGDGTPPAVFPSALCPVCAARRAAETARKKRWRHGRRD